MRAVVIGAAILGVVAVVWMSVQGGDSADSGATESSEGDPGDPGAPAPGASPPGAAEPAPPPAGSRTPPPRLPAAGATPGTGALPLAERRLFDEPGAERRDPAWATATEASMRARVDALLADAEQTDVPQLECRETLCRMLVTSGDEGALRRFMADLNSERGFVGDASMLAFEDVEQTAEPDGGSRYAVRVMLVYSR